MVTAINYNTHKILNNMTNIHKMFLPKIIKHDIILHNTVKIPIGEMATLTIW